MKSLRKRTLLITGKLYLCAVRTRKTMYLLLADYIKIISKLNRNANERVSKGQEREGEGEEGERERDKARQRTSIYVPEEN